MATHTRKNTLSANGILFIVLTFVFGLSGCQNIPLVCGLQGLEVIDARLLPHIEHRSLLKIESADFNGSFFLLYQQQEHQVDVLIMSLEGAELLELSLNGSDFHVTGLLKESFPATSLMSLLEFAFFPESTLKSEYGQQFKSSQEHQLRSFYVCGQLQVRAQQQQQLLIEMPGRGISMTMTPIEE